MVESDRCTSGICDNPKRAMTEEQDHDPLTQLGERDLRYIFRGLIDALTAGAMVLGTPRSSKPSASSEQRGGGSIPLAPSIFQMDIS